MIKRDLGIDSYEIEGALKTCIPIMSWSRLNPARYDKLLRTLDCKISNNTLHKAMYMWEAKGTEKHPIDALTTIATNFCTGMPCGRIVNVVTPYQFGVMNVNDVEPNLLASVRASSGNAKFLDHVASSVSSFLHEPFSHKINRGVSELSIVDGHVSAMLPRVAPPMPSVVDYSGSNWRSWVGDWQHKDMAVWVARVARNSGVTLEEATNAIEAHRSKGHS